MNSHNEEKADPRRSRREETSNSYSLKALRNSQTSLGSTLTKNSFRMRMGQMRAKSGSSTKIKGETSLSAGGPFKETEARARQKAGRNGHPRRGLIRPQRLMGRKKA